MGAFTVQSVRGFDVCWLIESSRVESLGWWREGKLQANQVVKYQSHYQFSSRIDIFHLPSLKQSTKQHKPTKSQERLFIINLINKLTKFNNRFEFDLQTLSFKYELVQPWSNPRQSLPPQYYTVHTYYVYAYNPEPGNLFHSFNDCVISTEAMVYQDLWLSKLQMLLFLMCVRKLYCTVGTPRTHWKSVIAEHFNFFLSSPIPFFNMEQSWNGPIIRKRHNLRRFNKSSCCCSNTCKGNVVLT